MAAGDFRACTICGDYGWFGESGKLLGTHRCKPLWTVTTDGEGFTAQVHASDASDAAERAGERYDEASGEGFLARGNSLVFYVTPLGGGERQRFSVEGQMVPEYRAYPAGYDE